uniref:GreA/GreB family elongation factor n=1 Tax=Caulobacter sp. (strain K31) TaxID=366602 RepID=B0T7C4_CAUSK
MPLSAGAVARPDIILAETEADRLSALATRLRDAAPQAADLLLEEIERAEIRADLDMPRTVVRMESVVQFVDEAHGNPRTVLLVYPRDADIAAGKVSVLSFVGAGLIGLSPHQAIQWPDRNGRQRTLRILKVRPPERLPL